jgi:hypothetical protein
MHLVYILSVFSLHSTCITCFLDIYAYAGLSSLLLLSNFATYQFGGSLDHGLQMLKPL